MKKYSILKKQIDKMEMVSISLKVRNFENENIGIGDFMEKCLIEGHRKFLIRHDCICTINRIENFKMNYEYYDDHIPKELIPLMLFYYGYTTFTENNGSLLEVWNL